MSEDDVDIIGCGDFKTCIIDGKRELASSNMTELIAQDYEWLNDESSLWVNLEKKNGQEIIYSDELDCGANTELIFDENIPAEFEEEVITIADESYEESVSSPDNITTTMYSSHPRSILIPQSEVKFKQTLMVNRSLLKTNQRQLEIQNVSRQVTPVPSSSTSQAHPSKFRQTVNFKPTNFVLNEHTMKIFKSRIKAIQKKKAQAIAREKKQRPKKEKHLKTAKSSKKSSVKKPKVNYISQKPKPIVDPKNSGIIVRVEKADEESDIEIDILSNSEEDLVIVEEPPLSIDDDVSGSTDEITVDDSDEPWLSDDETQKKLKELSESDEVTYQLMEDLQIPETELILEASNISNLERFVHSEFFVQRPTKTPERYLKIRNHIISMWNQFKPNYLSKTTARNGLKKCGDVNVIGRIHSMLEQIGAINFNCPEVSWIRPLKVLYELFQQNIKNKNQSSSKIGPMVEKKQRIRNSTNIFGANNYHDTNFTITHDGSTMISFEESSDSMINRIKSRTMHRTQFELIKCQRFSKDNVAPFHVSITLSCLMCLYFHALSSKLEIMGFLGGKCVGRDKLNLTRYKPCRTSNQTAINCEMCPVSQVEQSCNLIEEGYELLGWFHSHPNFPPIPSRTDLKTQAEMQLQFSSNNPFIGFILSCVDMDFKCIYMCKDSAYELEVEIIKDYADVRKDFQDVVSVIERGDNFQETVQKFIETGNDLLRQLSIPDSIENIIQDYI